MPREFIPHKEEEQADQAGSAGTNHAGQPAGKDFLSQLKNYLVIALLSVLIFAVVNNYIFARSGLSVGCGGCGTSSRAAISEEQLRRLGLEYYAANYGNAAVEAVVRDFGCHQEIYLYKNGQLVKRLAYRDGQLYQLPEVQG